MKFSFGIRIKIVEIPSIQPSPITASIPSESNKTTVHSLPVESWKTEIASFKLYKLWCEGVIRM